jgi:hypothetical protein
LALNGVDWLASNFGRFTPEKKDLGTHWLGGWVGDRADPILRFDKEFTNRLAVVKNESLPVPGI